MLISYQIIVRVKHIMYLLNRKLVEHMEALAERLSTLGSNLHAALLN